ncbi:DUF7144 family membrane protein [Nocardia farcinica]|uniref:DUF7144 domain-containing protein n=1 Tax=Nocardia farcinica (strain IFM 10152) TaxID=247156 RepID=Q5YUK7_NOCFA|nr:hypothetical protein [Nocardia farcinica]BAD58134.1 hypothetical protein NFA_32870 [Nocardia farcinica IFM 10152]
MTRVREPDPVGQSIAAITTIAAAVLLLTVAVLSILEGVAAVAGDEIFTIVPRYTYDLDVATWGWVHIVLGVLLAVVAIALMAGTTWARVTAAVFAALSILANFLWLPYYPWWSIVIIVLNVLVIWAVTTWQPDLM